MDIEFTRSDTQIIKFKLTDKKGNIIKLTDTEKLYFTVKQSFNSDEVLLQKVFPDSISYSEETGYYSFIITSEDTSKLNYGTYQYDIELTSTDDFVKTLSLGTLTVTDEVTFKKDEVY